MRDFLNKPYDLLVSKAFKLLFIFGGSGFALIFLWVFEPYGLYNLNLHEKIVAIGLYVGFGMGLIILQFFPLQRVFIKNYTVLNTIIWLILSFILIGTSSSIINSYLFNKCQFNLKGFVYFQGIILSINIMPVSAFVLIHYNFTLQKRLGVASRLNNSLTKNNGKFYNNGKEVIFKSENKSEGMTISLDALIFIRSMGNYIEVYFIEKDKIEKRLLRYSLSRVEQDNSTIPEIFRCHKGYIVNKRKIESISGNAAGFKLRLFDYDEPIPVSRKWNKELQNIISL